MENKNLGMLFKISYIYLALPMTFFILGWLDYGWAVLFSLIFGTALYWCYSEIKNDEPFLWSNRDTFILAVIALLWCFFAGIGYFYYQSFDYHFRNAVFRDLINYEWPVMYDKANTPMVYYMAFWLPVAALAKLCGWLGMGADSQFMLGNVFLLLYAVFGVVLIFLHLGIAVKAKSFSQLLFAVLVFILFSGLDIIGNDIFKVARPALEYHYEWWAIHIQYSSMTTCLFWVFNQFIPIILLMLLFFNERNIRHFGFLIALSLFFSPYPTAGIGVFMVVYTAIQFYKNPVKKEFISSEILSIPNLIGVFWLLPLSIFYFITNSEGMSGFIYIFSYMKPKLLLIFLGLEVLPFALILMVRYCKNMFVLTAFISLLLIPFCRVDEQNNFCMRASIPALLIFSIYCTRFLLDTWADQKHQFAAILLIIVLAIGSATPFMEFYRGIHYTLQAGKIRLVQDDIYTLNQRYIAMPIFGYDANHQYTAKDYHTDIFWQYIAKKHQPDGK